MWNRKLALVFIAAFTFSIATKVSAGTISGSFKGIVTDSETGFFGEGNVNGQLVTGTFATQFTSCAVLPPGAGTECVVPQLPVTFNIAGQSYSFGTTAGYEISSFMVTNTAAGQTLSLHPDDGDPTGYVALNLAGPASAFVAGDDLDTLHGGPVFASASTAYIVERYVIVADIQLTSVKVDGVPEPATWAMTIVGLSFTGAAIRARRRRSMKGHPVQVGTAS